MNTAVTSTRIGNAATRESEAKAARKRPFVRPVLERHERLPEITGFSF